MQVGHVALTGDYQFYVVPARRSKNELELWFYLHRYDVFDGVYDLVSRAGSQILVLDLDKTLLEQERVKGKRPEIEGSGCFQLFDEPGKQLFNRIHVRPGWKELRKLLKCGRMRTFVRTHASGTFFGKPAGVWVWEHLDPKDELQVRFSFDSIAP